MQVRYIIWTLGLLVFIGQGNLYAQSNKKGVSKSSFEELQKEIDYSKTKKKLVPKEFERQKPEMDVSPSVGFGGAGIFQGLAYFLIAGLVLFILYFVISGIKVKPRIDHSEIELDEIEDIEEIDADTGYTEALVEGDYRLALRMQFIKALQALSAKEVILWKPDKTNRHYISETRGQSFHQTFRSLAQTYEWVWYGNSAIGKETFDQLNPQFETFNKLDI